MKHNNKYIVFILTLAVLGKYSYSQPCSGTWSLQRPATIQCVTGQWIGWQNSSESPTCPLNPAYVGTQSNTFTFGTSVGGFSIDFIGFDGVSVCARMAVSVNGAFYPLTSANLSDVPVATCVAGSLAYLTVTADGYITKSGSSSANGPGRGRITISNVNATSVTLSTNDVNGTVFSNLLNCSTIVPLQLLRFEGFSSDPCNVKLVWQTGIEDNVRSIKVEKSNDGIEFKSLKIVSPKGNNSLYSVEMSNQTSGFYRLKIDDFDGSSTNSEIIKINVNCLKNMFSLSPNPALDYLEISGLTNHNYLLAYDMMGRKVLSYPPPFISQKFDIKTLQSGMYILQIIQEGREVAQFKFIKR